MKLCKDCWFFWKEKLVCCHSKAETDLTSGEKITPALEMRKNGYCGRAGEFWRPKIYSPNKFYEFAVECPDCGNVFPYTLFNDDSGERRCMKCEKELYLPGYGVNTISPKLIPKPSADQKNFMGIYK